MLILSIPTHTVPAKRSRTSAKHAKDVVVEGNELGQLSVDVALSDEQRAIMNLVCKGRSVFFTGSAGKFMDYRLRRGS